MQSWFISLWQAVSSRTVTFTLSYEFCFTREVVFFFLSSNEHALASIRALACLLHDTEITGPESVKPSVCETLNQLIYFPSLKLCRLVVGTVEADKSSLQKSVRPRFSECNVLTGGGALSGEKKDKSSTFTTRGSGI